MPKGKQNGAFRLPFLFQQHFSGFQYANHGGFVIQRAAPPNKTLGDFTGKWRISPLVERALIGGNHVHVCHEQHCREFGVGACPREEQRTTIDDLARQGVHVGIIPH